MIEAGAADGFVCWKLDRCARNTLDFLNFLHELEGMGAAFASATEPFDTTNGFGVAMITIVAALAQLESTNKSERIGIWQEHRRATGATPTGPRPYGYRRERNLLYVDEAEAAIVKRMAAAVLAGETITGIVRGLNADGYTTKDGRPWNRRGVVAILTGPTVAALRELDDRFVASSTWPAILDRQTWDEVRAILLDKSRRSGPGPARRWLLTGLATCGRDGKPMRARPNAAGTRYTCPACKLSIDAAQTDELIERALLALLDRRTWQRLRRRGRHVDTTDLEQRLADLAHQRANHEILDEVWQILNAGLMADLDAATAAPVTLPDVDDIRAAWPELPLAARRLVVEAATGSLVIGETAHRGVNHYDSDRVRFTPAV